eukprot:23234-Pyramimonas_sp.AAC.1
MCHQQLESLTPAHVMPMVYARSICLWSSIDHGLCYSAIPSREEAFSEPTPFTRHRFVLHFELLSECAGASGASKVDTIGVLPEYLVNSRLSPSVRLSTP